MVESTATNTNDANASNADENIHQVRGSTPKLNVAQLAVLVFYNVSGGPFGIEPSIRSAGNFYTILGFALLPLVWSLPEALVTAELGSAFQCSSGGVIWVQTAFGETPGAIAGYFNWISGATDNAIYPALFLTYLTGDGGNTLAGLKRFFYTSALSLVLAGLNFLGLEIVGNASVVVCIIAMSPFVAMIVIGAGKIDPSRWLQLPIQGPDTLETFDDYQKAPGILPLVSHGVFLRLFLNNMFWNLNSYDSAASFAEEVADVKTTYPRGIFLGLALCYVLYLLPVLVVTGATDYDQTDWVDGHLATAANDIGGDFLSKWTVFAIGISNLALFEAEMSADAYQLMGMAERGYLPSFFKKRSKFGTPTAGILTGTLVIVIFSVADFNQLVELLNANYAIALLMEFASFVKLRLGRKDLDRPYRVPISDEASVLLVLPPCLAILLIFAVSSWVTYLFVFMVFLLSLGLVSIQRILKERGLFEFENTGTRTTGDEVNQEDSGGSTGTSTSTGNDVNNDSIIELVNEKARLILASLGPNEIV
jgi:amino acid transporter